MCVSIVTQTIKDQGERTDGGHHSEQDGSRAKRLASGEIEAGGGKTAGSGGKGLLHGWSLVDPGVSRPEKHPAEGNASHSVDGLARGGVSRGWIVCTLEAVGVDRLCTRPTIVSA